MALSISCFLSKVVYFFVLIVINVFPKILLHFLWLYFDLKVWTEGREENNKPRSLDMPFCCKDTFPCHDRFIKTNFGSFRRQANLFKALSKTTFKDAFTFFKVSTGQHPTSRESSQMFCPFSDKYLFIGVGQHHTSARFHPFLFVFYVRGVELEAVISMTKMHTLQSLHPGYWIFCVDNGGIIIFRVAQPHGPLVNVPLDINSI